MAEARVEDDEETFRETREAGGARRNARAPTAASDRADRNKPEQRQSSSQGALSSIRAVIKRTSTRTAAPTEQTRERRRPEITILAAEPLATNSWFPGTSGAFPLAPPPAQPSWTGSVTVELPPPSYEQVIREKSREQNTQTSTVSSSSSSSTSSTSPSSSLSSSSSSSTPRHTTTIATQTDPEPSELQSCTRPSMRRPPKPPRPSLPLTPKPAEPVLAHTHSLIELDEPDPLCSTHTPTHPPSGEQCAVQTDFTPSLEPLTPNIPESSHVNRNSQSQALGKQEVTARPRPRPRSKALVQSVIEEEEDQDQPITREVKVQTLVRFKDNGTENLFAGFTDTLDIGSNKYLQDLLEVFGSDELGTQTKQPDDHSEENNKVESFTSESCSVSPVVTESLETTTRPKPRPRTQILKQHISTKPSDATTLSVKETVTSSEEQNKSVVHPVPAPRPLVKKSSVSQERVSSDEKSERCPLRLPRRPPLAARMSGASIQEDKAQAAEVPFNPVKPVTSRGREKCPDKPTSHKRHPPPAYTPANSPPQEAVSSVNASKSRPSLQHRDSEGKPVPLRPPPVKLSKSASSNLNPASTNQHSSSRGAKRGPPLPPRPMPGHPLYREHTSKTPQENTEVNLSSREPKESPPQKEKLLVVLDDTVEPTEKQGLPVSMKGQHQNSFSEEAVPQKSLELKMEKQTEELQPDTNTRYRARFAFNGEDGELTFHDGDVITLIAHVNEEWGRGSLNGRTGIFPLNFVQLVQESSAKKPTPESHAPVLHVREGQTGRALYDFTPEAEDELCLKVGDVVSSLEEVDEEWFVGELAGRRGIVPKNYIQVL